MADSKTRQKYLDLLITFAVGKKETKRGMSPEERKYIKSGVWQCPLSPTGAHHSIIRDGMMWCMYCGEERRVGAARLELNMVRHPEGTRSKNCLVKRLAKKSPNF